MHYVWPLFLQLLLQGAALWRESREKHLLPCRHGEKCHSCNHGHGADLCPEMFLFFKRVDCHHPETCFVWRWWHSFLKLWGITVYSVSCGSSTVTGTLSLKGNVSAEVLKGSEIFSPSPLSLSDGVWHEHKVISQMWKSFWSSTWEISACCFVF